MTTTIVQELSIRGPAQCEAMSLAEARAYCLSLAYRHSENFSVLSALVPRRLRDDFAALYAFCRWADDLGDEVGSRDRAAELLAWWRSELRQCAAGEPRHPVFVALEPVIKAHDLPIEPFDQLIQAFEQDQSVTRYDTWEQLIGYCRLSADPVGRLVLMIAGEPRTAERFAASDAICTALQLTNHWQDVKRDLIERDRIYIPRELVTIDRFEERLRETARRGHAPDREFLGQYRAVLRTCTERTWPLFERGAAMEEMVSAEIRPVIWLFIAGGTRVLRMVEMWNYETILHRPTIGAPTKLWLVLRAWLGARRVRRSRSAHGTPNGAAEATR
jgi:squalene synthase HpnC